MPKLKTMGCCLRHGIEFTACVPEDFPFDEVTQVGRQLFQHRCLASAPATISSIGPISFTI